MSHQDEIQAELESLNFSFGHISPVPAFGVPDHYFRDFPEVILAVIHTLSETSETEPFVDQLSRNMPYSVPGNYFSTLPDQLLMLLSSDSENDLPDVLNKPGMRSLPYSVPEYYFEDLEIQLLTRISDNVVLETESLSPLVAGLRDKPTFEVPRDYFEKPKTRIMTLPRTAEQSIKWTRWAAAAAVIFIFSLGGWKFLNTSVPISQKTHVQQILAQISDADIQEYLNYTLNDYEVFALSKDVRTQAPAINQKLFEDISEEEIKDYLEYNVY